jgi:hypothetical protein
VDPATTPYISGGCVHQFPESVSCGEHLILEFSYDVAEEEVLISIPWRIYVHSGGEDLSEFTEREYVFPELRLD